MEIAAARSFNSLYTIPGLIWLAFNLGVLWWHPLIETNPGIPWAWLIYCALDRRWGPDLAPRRVDVT